MRVTRVNCPWAYERGLACRPTASLELLATLFCWIAFGESSPSRGPGLTYSGATDNQGNSHVVARLLTTKFPLCVVLMELSARLSKAGKDMDLRWEPREHNVEADALSNFDFTGFKHQHRIHIDSGQVDFLVLPELMEAGESMYRDLERARGERITRRPEGPRKKRKTRGLKDKDPW